jgi:hypothetical protein
MTPPSARSLDELSNLLTIRVCAFAGADKANSTANAPAIFNSVIFISLLLQLVAGLLVQNQMLRLVDRFLLGSANSVKPEANGSIAGTLSAGSSVHANETVKTGSSGQAALGFIDKTNLHVGASSTVRLDKFVYDPNKGTGSVVIDATKGAFRFSTGAQNKGDFKV